MAPVACNAISPKRYGASSISAGVRVGKIRSTTKHITNSSAPSTIQMIRRLFLVSTSSSVSFIA